MNPSPWTRPRALTAAGICALAVGVGWMVRSLFGGPDIRTVAVVVSSLASVVAVIAALSITVHNDRVRTREIADAHTARGQELDREAARRRDEADQEASRLHEERNEAARVAAVRLARRVSIIRPHGGEFGNAADERLQVVVINFREDIIINVQLSLSVRNYGGEPAFSGRIPGDFKCVASVAHALSPNAAAAPDPLVEAPASIGDAVQAGALAPGTSAAFVFNFAKDNMPYAMKPIPVLIYTDMEDTTWECVYGEAPRVWQEFYDDPPKTRPWWREGPIRGTFEQ